MAQAIRICEMKRILFFLLSASVTIQLSAVSFEDSNFRVDTESGGFEQKNPDATIADAANLARKITLEYLRPRVFEGKITTDDLNLLYFCIQVMGTQAEQTYRQAAEEMGISGSGRSIEHILKDMKPIPKDISALQKIRPLPSDSKLESFARSYSKDQLQLAFLKFDNVRNRIDESRLMDYPINRVSKLSPYYGFKWIGGWWSWLIWEIFDCDFKINKAKIENKEKDILDRLKAIQDRIPYQKYVLEDANSPYRRAYMDLVYVASLIDYCRSHKWDGLEISDYEKKILDDNFEKHLNWAKEAASSLEKTFVTYPLMMEYCDLNACLLYYWYLESKFGKRDIISKVREDYLYYASYIADMGSRYAAHSTDPISIYTLEDYNSIFQWSFSTNKIDISDSKIIDEEFRKLVKNTSPILNEKYESQIKSALVNVKRDIPQTDVMMSREEVCENKYLKDVVGGIIGGKDLDNWCRQVEKMNERNWLYPVWSEEVESRPNPPKTEEVVRIVRYYRSKDAGPWVQTVAEALRKITGCSDEMKSLIEIVSGEDELDEMKEEILDTIDDRKLTAVLETRIKDDYGSQEKMVECWLEILSDRSMPDIRQLQSRVEKDVLVHWKMIRECEEKSWWNPSRWF